MAILKEGNDEYQVRIKRYPEKTYFDEYVKTNGREVPGSRRCDRYIVGEGGVRYTIEVTLKEGFDFGTYSQVQVQLGLPRHNDTVSFKDIYKPNHSEGGIKEKLSTELEYADVTVGGRMMLGARFAFQNLVLGTVFSLLPLSIPLAGTNDITR